jgi:hypothetical protein
MPQSQTILRAISGGALDVVARAGGDVAEENFLGAAAAHQHGERPFEIGLRVGVLVVDGKLHGQARAPCRAE